jgi:hypothetical protein
VGITGKGGGGGILRGKGTREEGGGIGGQGGGRGIGEGDGGRKEKTVQVKWELRWEGSNTIIILQGGRCMGAGECGLLY